MRFTIQRPDLGKALAETEKDIERAVTSGMRDAADGLKQDLREDVVAAGLGERLSRTWRGKTFPEVGESAEAAAYVWSRAPKVVDAYDRGVVIRSVRTVRPSLEDLFMEAVIDPTTGQSFGPGAAREGGKGARS